MTNTFLFALSALAASTLALPSTSEGFQIEERIRRASDGGDGPPNCTIENPDLVHGGGLPCLLAFTQYAHDSMMILPPNFMNTMCANKGAFADAPLCWFYDPRPIIVTVSVIGEGAVETYTDGKLRATTDSDCGGEGCVVKTETGAWAMTSTSLLLLEYGTTFVIKPAPGYTYNIVEHPSIQETNGFSGPVLRHTTWTKENKDERLTVEYVPIEYSCGDFKTEFGSVCGESRIYDETKDAVECGFIDECSVQYDNMCCMEMPLPAYTCATYSFEFESTCGEGRINDSTKAAVECGNKKDCRKNYDNLCCMDA
eukprot:Clim_evm16s43 gene=Clim_evmTU16s43